MIRVLTVDDHAPFRDAARAVISATTGFEALAEVGSAEDALDLLDVSLPGMDGLEACRRLTSAPGAPLVILISADDDPMLRESAHDYGAAGFVAKKELRPGVLRTLWNRYRNPAAAITPPG